MKISLLSAHCVLFLCCCLLTGSAAATEPADQGAETRLPAAAEAFSAAPETVGTARLTRQERAWLSKHKVLRHGIVDGHKPFEYLDENGSYQGLISDYMELISEQSGVRFETVVAQNFVELSKEMAAGSIDIASYLPPVWKHSLAYSDPIIQMPIVMFGRQNAALVTGLEALDKERVVVENPSRAQEFLTIDYPNLKLSYVDTPPQGLMAVVNGEADIFIHNVFSVEYYRRKLGLEPLKIISTTPYQFNIAFSVNPELAPFIPMIHKFIAGLSAREKQLIFDKWVNIEIEHYWKFKDIVYWGGFILFLATLLLGAILYWNTRLKAEVSERTRDLKESSEKLRNLARHMDKVREEEKAMLAREIHDDLGHTLAALMTGVRQLGHLVKAARAGKPEIVHEQLDTLGELVREASDISRKIMSDLRPSVLEDLGLVAAIEWLAHEFEAHYQINCRIQAPEAPLNLPDETAIALFRITQESLTNVAKHAGAKNAEILITYSKQQISLQIVDDGKGQETGNWAEREDSYGLQGIQERVLALGGELTLNGRSNNGGVSLRVQMPIES